MNNLNKYTRREWLLKVPASIAIISSSQYLANTRFIEQKNQELIYTNFPSQKQELVDEIVLVSHFNYNRVKELVTASPALAKASRDWGFGDWESALGAASHVGRKDIAELLIENGARPNIFTFTMMGKLNAVKSIIEAAPGIQKIKGPHGITLADHARYGGEDAKPVLEYLLTLEGADINDKNLTINEDDEKIYYGTYIFGNDDNNKIIVENDKQGNLSLKRNGGIPRKIFLVEENGFAPTGAPSVRIRFKVQNGKAVSLTVHDPEPILTALRKD